MRKASKSVDNRPMSFGPLLPLRITKARHQCDRASLRLAVLRMFEWQIQKHALLLGQAGVKPSPLDVVVDGMAEGCKVIWH